MHCYNRDPEIIPDIYGLMVDDPEVIPGIYFLMTEDNTRLPHKNSKS